MSSAVYSNPAGVALQASNGSVSLIGQTLALNGPTTVSGAVSLASGLTVTGPSTLSGTIVGNTAQLNACTVASSLNAGTLTSSTLTVSGTSTFMAPSSFVALTTQTASVTGSMSCATLSAGPTTLGQVSASNLTVSGASTFQATAAFASGLSVTGAASLQTLMVAGSANVQGAATFASSLAQPVVLLGTATSGSSCELALDRSAAGPNNVASVRMTPGTGLSLATNGTPGLTVGAADQQVSVTANRSGSTFVVRGDGRISSNTEILLDNTAKAAGQSGTVGVDSSGVYISTASTAKALTISPAGQASFSGNVVVPGTLQASGATTVSSLSASSISTGSLTTKTLATTTILGAGSAALALQGSDSAQTVTVSNVLVASNLQAKQGATLSLSGSDTGLTTQVVGTLKVDTIGKRAASLITLTDPVSALAPITCPSLAVNAPSGASQLTVTNTDSSASSDAAVAFNRSAFAAAYTGLVGIRPNVGFFVQLRGSLAISTDVSTRATAFAGDVSVTGALSATGQATISGALTTGGPLTCGGGATFNGAVTVSGSPPAIQLASGTSVISSLSADTSFCYLRYIDPSGTVVDRFKVDRNGAFTMNGSLAVNAGLAAGPITCSAFTTTSSNNTPSLALTGLSTSMAQVSADSTNLRLKYYDTSNNLQDRVLVDRSGNVTTTSNLTIPGTFTAATAAFSGNASVSGSLTVSGATALLGPVAVTGPAPFAITMGPASGTLASLAASTSGATLSVSDGTVLQPRLTISTAGLVTLPALTVASGIACSGPVSAGNLSVSSSAPALALGQFARITADSQLLHLQQWDGSNPPSDRLTISTTGLVTVPNGIATGTFVIGNDAGASLQLQNSSGTSWASVYADSSTLRLRSADSSNVMQDRIVLAQGGGVAVPGLISASAGLQSGGPVTVISGTAAGAGASYLLQAGSTVSSAMYSEQGFLALQVQNSAGSLVNRATFDTSGNVKLLGATAVSGAVTCTGSVGVTSQTPSIQLNNGASAPYAQLSATSGQVVLATTTGQNQLQNAITFDTSANMTCPGALTVGNITTSKVTSTGTLQGASPLVLTDPTGAGFGASISHSSQYSTPQIAFSIADNSGRFYPQLTIYQGLLSCTSLSLNANMSVSGNGTIGGALTVGGALSTTSSFRAASNLMVTADSSSGSATFVMTSSDRSTTNTQVVSTSTYASFLQQTPGSGLTERMRFDNASNVLFNASLIPNTTGLTLGTQANKWSQVWSVNTPNTTSDARLKRDVEELEAPLGLDLIRALRPVGFRWKDAAHGTRRHWGFIAQEVERAVGDDAAVVSRPEAEGGEYGLEYAGIIAPLVLAVQQLQERCDDLARRLRDQ